MQRLRTLILLLAALPSFVVAEIWSAVPRDAVEYQAIFRYQPNGGELDSISQAIQQSRYLNHPIHSRADVDAAFASRSRLLIVIGHNHQGVLALGDGSSVSIDELEARAAGSGKQLVILTCKGACYATAPAPQLKVSLLQAVELANQIQHRFVNLDSAIEVDPTSSELSVDPLSRFAYERPLSRSACLDLLGGTSTSTSRSMRDERLGSSRDLGFNGPSRSAFHNEVRRMIFRAEMLGVVSSGAKIVAVGSGAALLVTLADILDDEEDQQ